MLDNAPLPGFILWLAAFGEYYNFRKYNISMSSLFEQTIWIAQFFIRDAIDLHTKTLGMQ